MFSLRGDHAAFFIAPIGGDQIIWRPPPEKRLDVPAITQPPAHLSLKHARQVGSQAPCGCGSGKEFGKCCGRLHHCTRRRRRNSWSE